ncbi:MutS-related protein [Sphingobacterium faecale]|uniref:DNA mismatch repair protein n=1 Tax=Sphingobacterium faecale TaxID=2803775 RepID=A0ABS1R0P6_9SPHI|nr:DNA mismatch repair protein [Sphingobacterium faecale]MBL1408243.1 DNA mismatch repair protein [Sphingobacterium faecale]
MHYFQTDQQTLNDLNIFGKPGSESIFSLFDRTQTRGGAKQLEAYFRYPLADPEKINQRISILKNYHQQQISFPFKRELFDVIEQYLENTDERSKLPTKEVSVSEKLKGLVAIDPHEKNIQSGVSAIRELLMELHAFFKAGSNNPVEITSIEKLLNDPSVKPYIQEQGNKVKTLSYKELSDADVLFRFQRQDSLKAVLHTIYQIDVYISIAKVAQERGFSYPVAIDGSKQEVYFDQVYHPQVKNAKANTLTIDPQGNIIFLTGANMAGKSTLMKSIGIAMYLAHMGFPVAAMHMSFAVREGIYTSINLPDNLNKGISHFYAEVLRIKKVSQELGQNKNLFIIIDELFRGTNVKDAYEATVAITSAFASKRNCMFIVSTHIMEAGDTLKKKCKNIKFVYLPTRMEGHKPVYTYTLEEGITEDRHGMIIVNNEGIIDLLKRSQPLKTNTVQHIQT